eukprot:scaffold27207_cov105-Phaeocystis_antarctica.AAC.1
MVHVALGSGFRFGSQNLVEPLGVYFSRLKGVRGEPGRAKLRLARGSIGATAYRAAGTKQNRKRERRARG